MPNIRLPFVNYENHGLFFTDESRTKQSFADECNFNNVMSKWETSGLISHVNPRSPIYADVSNAGDYHQALELIRSAQDQFSALSSKIRDRFNNDPKQLLKFLNDPSNKAEAIALGLISAPPEAAASADQSAGVAAASDAPKGA